MFRKTLGLFLLGLMVVGAQTAMGQAACDRTCLRQTLDQYLSAIVKHDPAAAPLVVGFRQTENAINTRPGNGIWKTATALGKVQRRYFDPVSGQAAYFGTIEEGDTTAIVNVRVRVENRKLTEAEWYLARENDPGLSGPRQPGRGPANGYNKDYLTQNPPPERTVPAKARVDRASLVRIVESYFDAITSHDGSVAVTHAGCGRVENGSPTPAGQFLPPANAAAQPAGGGQRAGAAAGGGQRGGTNDCVSGLQNFSGQMAAARRMPLVDEEAQAVLAYAVFIRRPGLATPRNVFAELFFVDEEKIRMVYAAMFYPAPDLTVPNWPPYDGNWPLPGSIMPAAAPGAAR
jgi:hypothetical protein